MSDDLNPLQAGMSHLTLDSARGMLRNKPEEQRTQEPPQPVAQERPEAQPQAQEAEPAAEQAQPEQETTDTEAEEPPPIEAPSFWKKAAREVFATLPRDVQQQLVEQERERNTGVDRAMREAAEKRKSAESELTAAQNDRQRYQQQLNTFVPALQQQLQGKWAGVDWPKLARENPAEYVALQAEYQADAGKLQAAAFERKRAMEQQQEADRKAQAEVAQREWQSLTEKRPELKDRTKAEAWFKDINAYALDLGYTPEQIQSNTLHTNLIVLEKAMLYDRAQSARTAAVARPVPKVQTPGTARTKADRSAADRDALLKRAEQTGEIRDFAKLLRI